MADITTYYYGGTDTPHGTYPDRTAYIGGKWNAFGGMGIEIPSALLAELTASDDWEIYFKHEFPNYAGWLLSAWADSGKQTWTVNIGYFGYSTGNKLRLFFKDADGSELLAEESDVSLSKGRGTYHEVKITFASGVLSVQTRAQNTDEWTTFRSCQSSKNISFGTCGRFGDDFGFQIYCDRCYIKIGGQYRWSAAGTLYVPDAQQETPGGDEPSIEEDMGITQIRQNQVRGLESGLAGMASAISGKVDLAPGVAQTDVDYVIDSYVNGTSWCRVYKSRWCEQGGQTNIAPGRGDYSLAFLQEFADTNYNYLCQPQITDKSTITPDRLGIYRVVGAVYSKATTGVQIQYDSITFTGKFFWRAEGYLAS